MNTIKHILRMIKNAFFDFWHSCSLVVVMTLGIILGSSVMVLEYQMPPMSSFASSLFVFFAVFISVVPFIVIGTLLTLVLNITKPKFLPDYCDNYALSPDKCKSCKYDEFCNYKDFFDDDEY